jgi:Aconitase B
VLEDYKKHCEEREEMGIPPLPLSAEQTADVVNLLKKEHQENELLLHLLKERVTCRSR